MTLPSSSSSTLFFFFLLVNFWSWMIFITVVEAFLPSFGTGKYYYYNHHHRYHFSDDEKVVLSSSSSLSSSDGNDFDDASFSSNNNIHKKWTDNAPSWEQLHNKLLDFPTGRKVHVEKEQTLQGIGPPNIKSRIRLFSSSSTFSTSSDDDTSAAEQPRVILYRDDSGWCPYCQRVWLFLELYQIPYQVQTVPLNAYGDKPAWFTRQVDGGKLPAIEIDDNTLYTESLHIMEQLQSIFVNNHDDDGSSSTITSTTEAMNERYLELDKELQSAWFSFVFYPVEGENLISARDDLLSALDKFNTALDENDNNNINTSPWFLDGDKPSIIDIYFIPIIERLIASVLYWKGLTIRRQGGGGGEEEEEGIRFNNLNRWITAFEQRPEYMATKSDYYTLVMSIPSQNGPGYSIEDARCVANAICGLNGAWELPLRGNNATIWSSPLYVTCTEGNEEQEEEARHEAAYHLINGHEQIVAFAARGAGEPGRPSYHAELSDPYAEPNEDFFIQIDICLRHITLALIVGSSSSSSRSSSVVDEDGKSDNINDDVLKFAKLDMLGKCSDGTGGELRPNWYEYEDEDGQIYWWNDETGESTWTPPTRQLDTCLSYLRDRIGVPRDMKEPAAMQLRAHLNWAIDLTRISKDISAVLL